MKRVIRRGVFETNSSSMHSIVVVRDDLRIADEEYFDAWVMRDGRLCISELDFGRSPFEVLNTAKDKFRYVIASKLGNASYSHVNNDTPDEYMKGLIDELTQIATRIFIGCTALSLPDYGYVDHDSCYLLENFLKREKITLEEFVCNPKYIVIIDGDEYCILNSMKKSGLIDTDAIEKEYCENDYAYDYVHERDKAKE